MGYIEGVMGDTERLILQTHQHLIVLLERVIGSLLAFVVLVGLGMAVLLPPNTGSGNQIRTIAGVVTLCILVIPLYLIVSAWIRGERGGDFVRAIWQAVLAGILIVAVAVVILLNPDLRLTGWVGIVLAVIPLVEIIRTFLDWLNERYIITNRRVMVVRGTINKLVRDSALEKVNDVELEQSIVGRALGYGTVQIITGSDIGVNMFRRISRPVRFKRAMLNAKAEIHSNADEERVPSAVEVSAEEGDEVGAEAPAVADIPDLIVELDELRQKGIISEEEFQAKKTELLDRL